MLENSHSSTVLRQLTAKNQQLRLEQDLVNEHASTLSIRNAVLRQYIHQLDQAQSMPPVEAAAAVAAAAAAAVAAAAAAAPAAAAAVTAAAVAAAGPPVICSPPFSWSRTSGVPFPAVAGPLLPAYNHPAPALANHYPPPGPALGSYYPVPVLNHFIPTLGGHYPQQGLGTATANQPPPWMGQQLPGLANQGKPPNLNVFPFHMPQQGGIREDEELDDGGEDGDGEQSSSSSAPPTPRAPAPLLPPYAYSTFPAPPSSPTMIGTGLGQFGTQFPPAATSMSAFQAAPHAFAVPGRIQADANTGCSGQMAHWVPQSPGMVMAQYMQDGGLSQQNAPMLPPHGASDAVAYQGLPTSASTSNPQLQMQLQSQQQLGQQLQQPPPPAADQGCSPHSFHATDE